MQRTKVIGFEEGYLYCVNKKEFLISSLNVELIIKKV